jgi:AcrR family transcriptional regulator
MKRKYELKRRAERQAETRQRIVEAAVDLHSSIGPARTTLSAIAAQAGVQRHTVYAHFPDETTLFRACSTHWRETHPFPDPKRWQASAEPARRLRRALNEVYEWYAAVEADFALFTRDSYIFPAFWQERRQQLAALADELSTGLPRRRAVRAAIGHALEFETWRSLVRREGLTGSQAVDAMIQLVTSV